MKGSFHSSGPSRSSRDSRSDRPSRDSRPFQQREMHKTVCDKCKQPCEVPFKPTKGKPVYCKECYKKLKGY